MRIRGPYHTVMGHLQVATLLLLLPRIVWSQAPATTAVGANPLLSLNVPNLGNLLGNLLGTGGYGGMFNGGYGGLGFGNMMGFGNMLGLFHNNNLFFNQLLIFGLIGFTVIKLVILAVLIAALLTGGLIIKMAVLVLVLTWGKFGHVDHHSHYRSDYRNIPHHSDLWSSKSALSDNSFLWSDRKLTNRRTYVR